MTNLGHIKDFVERVEFRHDEGEPLLEPRHHHVRHPRFCLRYLNISGLQNNTGISEGTVREC